MPQNKTKIMKMFVNVAVFGAAFFVSAGEARAADYYASPSGDGDGLSENTPFQIADFWPLAEPGDRLILMDGVYRESRSMLTPPADYLLSGNQIVGCKSYFGGSQGNPIIVKAKNDGKVAIDGQSQERPAVIDCANWINIEGIIFKNSSASVAQLSFAHDNIVRRCSFYNAKTGNNHLLLVTNGAHNNLIEDNSASQLSMSGAGRYAYVSFGGSFNNTFRRNYAKYYTHNGGGGPCSASANYGGSYNTWENNIFDVSLMPAGCSNAGYQLAIFGEGIYHDTSHNKYYGNVSLSGQGASAIAYGESFGSSSSSSDWEFHDNVFLSINGLAPVGIYDNDQGNGGVKNWIIKNNTIGFLNLSHGDAILSNGLGSVVATNNSFFSSYSGERTYSGGSISSIYNNFSSITNLYGGNITGRNNDRFISPAYPTSTYGNGAYLMIPPALQGQGENGADIGAEVLYEYQDGVLTNEPLWPWPMEDRVLAETGISVTYESSGGIWTTLDGVYENGDTTPPAAPSGLSVN